ncbi:MAG: RNA-binding S4 domain-containing protein [Oscillospiraceae bacterium]
MRIDKFLKVSRIVKRRTVANEVADAGRIMVNDRPVKASYAVKIGDEITVQFGTKPVRVKVVSLDVPSAKDIAREMYTVIEG